MNVLSLLFAADDFIGGGTAVVNALVTLATALVLLAGVLLVRWAIPASRGAPVVVGIAVLVAFGCYWLVRNPTILDGPFARSLARFF